MTVFALSSSWYWYFTRGTGMVALILLSAVMVLGILGPLRISSREWPRFAIETVHRDLSLLALVVIVVHVVTTVLDGYAPISLIAGIVPFDSAYRPLWLGLGAISFDLMLALVLTSLLRRRVGYPVWRWIHWLAYLSWPLAVLHGIGTGSDAGQAWALAVTAACVITVLRAFVFRLQNAPALQQGLRATALAAVIAFPLALAVFAAVGPLSSDWAARAGTPASLLK